MATTFTSLVNNYSALVSLARSSGGTSLVVSTTTKLPTLTAGQFVRLSVFRNSVPVTILKVTAINTSTNTLTISGPIEMADADVQVNDLVTVTDTAGVYQELQAAVNGIETGTDSVSVLATNSSTARTLSTRFSEVFNVKDWGAVGDGATDDAPAINAVIAYAIAQSAYTTHTIYFPAGNYAIHNPIYVAKSLGTGQASSSIRLTGDGSSSQIIAKAAMTEMIRIEDLSSGIFERLQLTCSSAVSVAAIHLTAYTSAENNNFRDVTVGCGTVCPVAFGVSLDQHNIVRLVRFTNCKASNATKAGFKFGDGTLGNVEDIACWGCQATSCQICAWMDAAPLNWNSGTATSNSVADFFMSAESNGPIVIEGVQSNLGNIPWVSRGSGNAPPIRLSDISCNGWTGLTYTYDSGTQTFTPATVEGFVISHRYSGVLTIMNCAFLGGPATHPGGRLDIAGYVNTILVNCLFGESGTSAATLAGNFPFGGKGIGKDYMMIGGKTVTSASTPYDSPIDFWCDGPAFFNNTLAINTSAPTAQVHQIGGSYRLQKIADPVIAPSISQVGGGSTPYTYYYVYKDQVGNRTLVSPAGTTSSGPATIDSDHYNIVTMPEDNTVSTVDILRGDINHYAIKDWNPYSLTPRFVYNDVSPGTSVYTPPTRNETADMTIDGNLTASSVSLTGLSGDVSSSTVTATGSTTARTLAARFFAPFNVMDWGCVGNGIVDDQPAIMALLRYVSNISTSTGFARTIYFPAGSYAINNPILVGKQYHLKADNTAWPAATPWPGINFVGDGYSSCILSNNASGITEILRFEDTSLSKITGLRLLVVAGKPVTTAALHITAISSGETHRTEDVVVECQGQVGGSCPVGIGVSLDWPNDTAQIFFVNCKVTYAKYAGFMIGNGQVGNVLDCRMIDCISIGAPFGVFGFSAPYVWYSGATTVNWVSDFYALPCTGPIIIDGVRSELSNKFYANYGGSASRAPVSIMNSVISLWGGATYTFANGAPPFYTVPVSVTKGSTTVTVTSTIPFKDKGRFAGGTIIAFQNDPTHTYTFSSASNNTTFTISPAFNGPAGTTATFCHQVMPVATLDLAPGVDRDMVVTLSTTGGVTTVTGTNTHFSQMATNGNKTYLIFANDVLQASWRIANIASDTVLTLTDVADPGMIGSTTCNCPNTENYAIAHAPGGTMHLQALSFSHNPASRYYPRFYFPGNTYVTAININAGIGSALGTGAATVRSGCFFGGDRHTVTGPRYTILPGPAITTADVETPNPLGFVCDHTATFNDRVSLNIYDSQTDQYHQLGGGIKLVKVTDPTTAITTITQGGTPGTTDYYYWYVCTDVMGNLVASPAHRTLPVGTAGHTGSGAATINSTNFNNVTIPVAPTGGIFFDILRNTTNALSGANFGSVATGWNPFDAGVVFKDTVTSPTAYTVPTRNTTGDINVGGLIHLNGTTSPYAGTGGGEINGAQTASVTDPTTTSMIQTLWNWARAVGMIA